MRSDEQLYDDLRRGDEPAFADLYRRYERRLFGFLVAYVKSREDAEEILHEVFRSMLEEARGQGEVREVGPWLFTLARNRALNWRRRQKTAQTYAVAVAPLPSRTAEHQLCEEERSEAVARAVEALPVKLAEVYQLRAAGFSYEEIAGRLRIPLGTVRSRLNHMTQKLRKDLSLWTAR